AGVDRAGVAVVAGGRRGRGADARGARRVAAGAQRAAIGDVGAWDARDSRSRGADGTRRGLGDAIGRAAVAQVRVGVVTLLVGVDVAVAAPVQGAGGRARVAEHAVLRAVVAFLAALDDVIAADLELAGGGAAVVRGGVAVVALLGARGLAVAALEQAEARAAVAIGLVAVVAALARIDHVVAAGGG